VFCGLLLPDESAFGQKSESQGAQKNKKIKKQKNFLNQKITNFQGVGNDSQVAVRFF